MDEEMFSIFTESTEDMGILYQDYEPILGITDNFLNDVERSVDELNKDPFKADIDLSDRIRAFKRDVNKKFKPKPIVIGNCKKYIKTIKAFQSRLDKLLGRYAAVRNKTSYGGNYKRAIVDRPKVYSKDIDESHYARVNKNIRNVDRALDWVEKILIDLFNMADQDMNILTIVNRVYAKNKIYESSELPDGVVEEDVADNITPMLPGNGVQEIDERRKPWIVNTHDKKTGDPALYISRNHDMANYIPGQDGSDDDDDMDYYRRRRSRYDDDDDDRDYGRGSYDDSDEEEDEPTPKEKQQAIQNYYYYTYNNSMNKNMHSFNKDNSSHDDHSVGKHINSHNNNRYDDDEDEDYEDSRPYRRLESAKPWELDLPFQMEPITESKYELLMKEYDLIEEKFNLSNAADKIKTHAANLLRWARQVMSLMWDNLKRSVALHKAEHKFRKIDKICKQQGYVDYNLDDIKIPGDTFQGEFENPSFQEAGSLVDKTTSVAQLAENILKNKELVFKCATMLCPALKAPARAAQISKMIGTLTPMLIDFINTSREVALLRKKYTGKVKRIKRDDGSIIEEIPAETYVTIEKYMQMASKMISYLANMDSKTNVTIKLKTTEDIVRAADQLELSAEQFEDSRYEENKEIVDYQNQVWKLVDSVDEVYRTTLDELDKYCRDEMQAAIDDPNISLEDRVKAETDIDHRYSQARQDLRDQRSAGFDQIRKSTDRSLMLASTKTRKKVSLGENVQDYLTFYIGAAAQMAEQICTVYNNGEECMINGQAVSQMVAPYVTKFAQLAASVSDDVMKLSKTASELLDVFCGLYKSLATGAKQIASEDQAKEDMKLLNDGDAMRNKLLKKVNESVEEFDEKRKPLTVDDIIEKGMKSFKQRHHFHQYGDNPNHGIITVEGREYLIDMDVKNPYVTIEHPTAPYGGVQRQVCSLLGSDLAHGTMDDPKLIVVDKTFFRMSPIKQDSLLLHEIAHHELQNDYQTDQSDEMRAKRADALSDFQGVSHDQGNIFDPMSHINTNEFEADRYAANRVGEGNLKGAMDKYLKYTRQTLDADAKKNAYRAADQAIEVMDDPDTIEQIVDQTYMQYDMLSGMVDNNKQAKTAIAKTNAMLGFPPDEIIDEDTFKQKMTELYTNKKKFRAMTVNNTLDQLKSAYRVQDLDQAARAKALRNQRMRDADVYKPGYHESSDTIDTEWEEIDESRRRLPDENASREEIENDRPTSDHPVKDTLTDLDVKTVKYQQKAKRGVQNIQNAAKAAVKPVKRTSEWLGNIVNQWKDISETNVKERMADPHARRTLFSAVRTAIIAGSLYKAGLLMNPFFLFLAATRFVTKRHRDFRLRNEVIAEMKAELAIIDEKIQDCERKNDLKGKYKMMRYKTEIQKKLYRVGGGKGANKII